MEKSLPKDGLQRLYFSLALFALVLILFHPVFRHPFIPYDDPQFVTDNYQVKRGLTLEGLSWAFTTTYYDSWHPLTWISHMTDVEFFGLNPGWHHFVNVLFHAANSIILFLALNRMTKAFWRSGFVTVLFAIHPLHVESVTWVSERKDVLSTFFLMLSIWAYARFTEEKRPSWYMLVALFFVLGLMSKGMILTLPFALLLLDLWPLKRVNLFGKKEGGQKDKSSTIAGLVLEKAPLFAISLASVIITYYAQAEGDAVLPLAKNPLWIRAFNAVGSYGAYIYKMVWPESLSIFYPHLISGGILSGKTVAIYGALLAVLSIACAAQVKKRPYLFTGWFWYLGTLVPAIGLIQVNAQAMADRYTYVPIIGLFMIITWGVPEIFDMLRLRKQLLTGIALIAITALLPLTWRQIGFWRSTYDLFTHALEVTENNWMAHNNVGADLGSKGRFDEAIYHLREAVRINPNYSKAHHNLFVCLYKKGLVNEGLEHLYREIELDPGNAPVRNTLGFILYKEGFTEKALEHFREAIRLNPYIADAHKNMGLALLGLEKTEEAARQFQIALEINPYIAEAYFGLGSILAGEGKDSEALMVLEEALMVNPDYEEARALFDKIKDREKGRKPESGTSS